MRLGCGWLIAAVGIASPLSAAASPAVHPEMDRAARRNDIWRGPLPSSSARDASFALALAATGCFVALDDAPGELHDLFLRLQPEIPPLLPVGAQPTMFVDAFTGSPVFVLAGAWQMLAPASFDGTLLWLLEGTLHGDERPFTTHAVGADTPAETLFALSAAPLEFAFRTAARRQALARGGRGVFAPGGIPVHNPEPGSVVLWLILAAAGGGQAWRRRRMAAARTSGLQSRERE